MKILLLSDTHGDTNRIDDVLEKHKDINTIIHLGDVHRDYEYITYVVPQSMPVVTVCGNNELYAEAPYCRVLEYEGIRFYISHGYIEGARRSHLGLIRKAKEHDASVVLYGHTHTFCDETESGIRLINPGALCYPGCRYAILDIENKKLDVTFYTL